MAAIIAGTASRVAAYFLTPTEWAGLHTLLPPLVSLLVFVAVAALSQNDRAPGCAPAEVLEDDRPAITRSAAPRPDRAAPLC